MSTIGGPPKIRILLVDDDEDDFVLTRDLISRVKGVHYYIDWHSTFEEGLARMVQNQHDVCLVDYRLGKRNGLELLQEAIAGGCRKPIILLTGKGYREVDIEAMQAGAMDYLEKDKVTPERFERSIRYAIERKTGAELREKLQIAEHLESFNQYVAGLAHQIRDPASVVMANLCAMEEMLADISSALELTYHNLPKEMIVAIRSRYAALEVDEKIDEIRQMAETNLHGMDRIKEVVSDLTAFAQKEREETSLVQINDLVATASQMLSKQMQDRMELVLVKGTLPLVAARRGAMIKVLVSLLHNACQAMEGDDPQQNKITVSTRHTRGTVVVVIEDTGRGIAPSFQGRIFTPFYTTWEGAGLGLSLSLEAVLQHKGKLTCHSTEGEGSRFEVQLPADTGHHVAPRRKPDTGPQRPRRARILVVDDEPEVRKSLQRLLGFHHEVLVAEDGACALEVLRDDDNFDVILCDLVMHGIDGLVLYEELQYFAPQLQERLVFLSDGTMNDRIQHFSSTHDDRIYCKPVEGEVIKAIVARVMAAQGQLVT